MSIIVTTKLVSRKGAAHITHITHITVTTDIYYYYLEIADKIRYNLIRVLPVFI